MVDYKFCVPSQNLTGETARRMASDLGRVVALAFAEIYDVKEFNPELIGAMNAFDVYRSQNFDHTFKVNYDNSRHICNVEFAQNGDGLIANIDFPDAWPGVIWTCDIVNDVFITTKSDEPRRLAIQRIFEELKWKQYNSNPVLVREADGSK
ncbi:hypothetical protein HYS31_06355 [Candidatus Woesearchaeota archaeon]|nr:hypothetical protein [Candidatus Woesearchaeota archaeon]